MSTVANAMSVSIGGNDLHVHHWNHNNTPAQLQSTTCVFVIYHGFLAHGNYPTVRYAAEKLAAAGYFVVAADLPGHGESPGLRGMLPPPEKLVQIGVDIAQYARDLLTCDPSNKKVFLLGSSLGGAMALSVAHQMQSVAGVVLLAPMLRLGIDTPTRYLLRFFSLIAPTLQAIPSSSTSMEKQYRDPQKRSECKNDALSISAATIRIGSARTCVELACQIEENFPLISVPFLLMVADQDVVVDSLGSLDLYKLCKSEDKTIKRYPALHGLLCEPMPLIETIENDMIAWIQKRV